MAMSDPRSKSGKAEMRKKTRNGNKVSSRNMTKDTRENTSHRLGISDRTAKPIS